MFENMKTKVSIIDYGLCNLYNVSNALKHVGAEVEIIDKPIQVKKASHIVLPGVGAFKNGMRGLTLRNLVEPLREHIKDKHPFLGICLGMQMMLTTSYEFGVIDGLDIISGKIVKIPNNNKEKIKHKIPHIGWNKLNTDSIDNSKTILKSQNSKAAHYFIHSYMAECDYKENILASTNYNGISITSVVNVDNAYGCQFHPEKSGKYGLKILNEFIQL